MKKEAENWFRQAEDDLGTSEDCMKSKRYRASAFYSQQASEKALKALQIQKFSRFDKVHDLLALAGTVNAPDEVIGCCVKLNPYYTITRYPDVGVAINERTAEELVCKSRKVLEWAKQSLKQ